MMTTTPYDARRSMRIREAYEAVYHLAHVVKDYPNVRKDGFGLSHLARIEKLLADTTEVVTELGVSERKQLLDQTKPEPQQGTQDVVVVGDVSALSVVRAMEQTIPPSLLERIASRTDCD